MLTPAEKSSVELAIEQCRCQMELIHDIQNLAADMPELREISREFDRVALLVEERLRAAEKIHTQEDLESFVQRADGTSVVAKVDDVVGRTMGILTGCAP